MNTKMRQTMNIAFTCNDRYVKYVSVTMISILKNHVGTDIHFYLICNDISDKSERYIDQIRLMYRFEISYLSFNAEQLSGIKKSFTPHVTDETNYRYFVADLIPDVDKLLFLDGDLVADGSLDELYHTDIENFLVAIAKDPLDRGLKWWFEEFNIPQKYPYLNTGVFLVNMKKWRDQRLGERLVQAAKKYGSVFRFPDQDAINVLCYDKNCLIDQKYNFCPELHWDNLDERAAAEKNAVIYHWAGPHKPWIGTEYNYADIFWKYARLTPFYAEILYENLKIALIQNTTQQINAAIEDRVLKDMVTMKGDVAQQVKCDINNTLMGPTLKSQFRMLYELAMLPIYQRKLKRIRFRLHLSWGARRQRYLQRKQKLKEKIKAIEKMIKDFRRNG